MMKLFCGAIILACTPVMLAGNEAAYPTEKLAAFVVEKLDVTTIPAAIRPMPLKGKRTFADYGYAARKLEPMGALLRPPQGVSQISIEVLEVKKSGIYVCVNGHAEKKSEGPFQRVFLLKLKNADGLLKGRESWTEFSSCPVIGGADGSSLSTEY